MINYADGCDGGPGLCEGLVRYSTVPVSQRKQWSESSKKAAEDLVMLRGGGDGENSECTDGADSEMLRETLADYAEMPESEYNDMPGLAEPDFDIFGDEALALEDEHPSVRTQTGDTIPVGLKSPNAADKTALTVAVTGVEGRVGRSTEVNVAPVPEQSPDVGTNADDVSQGVEDEVPAQTQGEQPSHQTPSGNNVQEVTQNSGGRKRANHWKTEYLIYCCYVVCGFSQSRICALFGVSQTMVHNIVYAWANLLCLVLPRFFPTPSRNQLLKAYPKSVIQKFGHANIFMLLDATEIFAQIASLKTVNSIFYSAYKHNSTLKWLVGCDPIGVTWVKSISDGYPGSISDPVVTDVSNILEEVPFGMAVEVDKGFLIENTCAKLGITVVRPMKFLDNQKQQSAEDTALTQKIGKTRIPVEQANGGMKGRATFFDRRIRIDQVGIADLIFVSTYLMMNWKLPFIQGRNENNNEADGRPCKAQIRWYGGEDDGLVDVRPYVELWGIDSEIARWYELRKEYTHKSKLEISLMVLQEDIPGRIGKEHRSKFD